MNFFDKIKDAFDGDNEAEKAKAAQEAAEQEAAENARLQVEHDQQLQEESAREAQQQADAAAVAEQERAVAEAKAAEDQRAAQAAQDAAAAQAAQEAAAAQAAQEEAAAAQAAAAAAQKPVISVAEVRRIVEADSDPSNPTGQASNPAVGGVIENALAAAIGQRGNIIDGSLGTSFQEAYSAFQESLGYSGADADGIPGRASLQALADRTGQFTLTD